MTTDVSDPPPSVPPVDDVLTDLDLTVLKLAGQRWRFLGMQEVAVRDATGYSMPRYTQHLLALLDRPAALLHDPVLVRRLQRLQATRRRARAA